MKALLWSLVKSERLKKTRGVSFEELIQARLVAVKQHPGRVHQHIILFDYKGYIWVVPFVKTDEAGFLKTLFPSRKYTRLYRKGAL